MTALDQTSPLPRRRGHSLSLTAGAILVGLHILIGLLSLVWLPYDPAGMTGGRLAPPSWEHWAGTDRLGRDFFTQIMIGSRIALIVGMGAVAIGAAIGVTLGTIAAFATKLLDDALAATLDILIAFPTLLIAMLVVAASDTASLGTAILALGIALSAIVARLTRILVKRVLLMDYITAAYTSGTSRFRAVILHVLPNIWPTLIVTSDVLRDPSLINPVTQQRFDGKLSLLLNTHHTFISRPMDPGQVYGEWSRDSQMCLGGALSRRALIQTYGLSEAQADAVFASPMRLTIAMDVWMRNVRESYLTYGVRFVGD